MQLKELFCLRQSCRNFDAERKVEKEKLENIMELARLAPSACSSQPYSFIVVTDDELVKEVARCTQSMGMNKHCSTARAFIVMVEENAGLLAKTGGRLKDQDYASIDMGIVSAHIVLAATEQGLSTCMIGWFDEKKLKEILQIDEKKRVRLVFAVGYAAADDKIREKKRKDLDKLVTYR